MKLCCVLFLALVSGLWTSFAQNPAPGPLPARVRAWFAVPPDQPSPTDGSFPVLQKPWEVSWGGTNSSMAFHCPNPYTVGSFESFPGQALTVSLRQGRDDKNLAGTASLPLKPGGWYTLVVHPANKSGWFSLLEDKVEKPPGPAGKDAPPPEPADSLVPVRFVSLVSAAKAEFVLSKSGQKASVTASAEPGQVLFRLPPGVYAVSVRGRFKDQDFERGLEMEIVKGDRPILLFTEDAYGRLRIPVKSLPFAQP